MADPTWSFGKVAELLNRVNGALPGLHIILMTHELRSHFETVQPLHALQPGEPIPPPPCDMEWAENGFDAPSIYGPDIARAHAQIR